MPVDRLLTNFEEVKSKECQVTGTSPSWLNGTLIRNGPGMFNIGDSKYKHLFDGMAYLAKFHFENGKMLYSGKYLDSDSYRLNMRAERIICDSFGTHRYPDPCKNIFQRFFSYFWPGEHISDNALVAFCQYGDEIYAVTETPQMIQIHLETLNRVKKEDLSKYLTLNTQTAHQNGDEEGNVYNVGSLFGKHPNYVFSKSKNVKDRHGASPNVVENTELIGSLPCTDPMKPCYYHSFGMSRNYMILIEQPLRIDLKKLILRNVMNYSFHDTMSWDDSLGVNVLVMNKETGKKLDIKFTSDSFFTFHHANSYEKDGFLVMDYCRYRDVGNLDGLCLENMRSKEHLDFAATKELTTYLHRMILPLQVPEDAKTGENLLANCSFARKCSAILQKDGSVHVQDMRVCDASFEFPRYNWERFNMKPYKYVYGSDFLSYGNESLTGVIKSNTEDNSYIVWNKDKSSQIAAEPVFVPHPTNTDEDDGILIVPILTTEDGDNSYVVILDAKDLHEQARYTIPEARLHLSFHGMFASKLNL